MDVANNAMTDECVEVLVQTRGEDPKLRQGLEEAGLQCKTSGPSFSSFQTLIRTALALKEDPRDEHSYAYTEKKQACDVKEKDHCYSTCSKLAHRKVQSLSDENLYRSSESDDFLSDSRLVLPHYHSKDSALDVTGFDTISEKCLSYDNINVKTVDVITQQCIFPGLSDPDISKMTIKNDENNDQTSSVPSSPPSNEEQLTIEHNYFKSIRKKMQQSRKNYLRESYISPLWDHSYNTNQKHKSVPVGNSSLKRGRSSDKIDSCDGYLSLKTQDLMKSPFLDHSYQSCELKNVGKRQNVGKKLHSSENTQAENKKYDATFPSIIKPIRDGSPQVPRQLAHDHAYGQLGNVWPRSRSYSLSETQCKGNALLKSDHCYTSSNGSSCLDEDCSSDDGLSDSGTESLNGDEQDSMSATSARLDAFTDHSYVTEVR